MLKFLEKFKSLFNRHYINEDSNQELSKEIEETACNLIPFGTIIMAERFSTEEERLAIPEGHRSGLYIVIEDNIDYLYVLYISGNKIKRDRFQKFDLLLEGQNYQKILYKDIHVHVHRLKVIDKSRIISTYDSLISSDIEELLKRMELANMYGLYKNNALEIRDIPFGVGDIFTKHGTTYVIYEKDTTYECIPLRKNSKDYQVQIDGFIYSLDFGNMTSFDNLDGLERKSIISKTQQQIIALKYQTFLDYQNLLGTVTRGSLVKVNNDLYYIFGINGNTCNAFLIATKSLEGYCRIIIAKKTYYTNFTSQNFEKEDVNSVLANAYESEITTIKNQKKSFNKTLKGPVQHQKYDRANIDIGAIVYTKLHDTMMLVIGRDAENLQVVNYDLALIGKYIFTEIFAEDALIAKRINNNLLKVILGEINAFLSQEQLEQSEDVTLK